MLPAKYHPIMTPMRQQSSNHAEAGKQLPNSYCGNGNAITGSFAFNHCKNEGLNAASATTRCGVGNCHLQNSLSVYLHRASKMPHV